MKFLPGAILALAICCTACSQQSKEEYHQAGQSLTKAADETGKALKTDMKAAGEATKKAAANAKTETKEHSKPTVKDSKHPAAHK
jgi:hypothetical protein